MKLRRAVVFVCASFFVFVSAAYFSKGNFTNKIINTAIGSEATSTPNTNYFNSSENLHLQTDDEKKAAVRSEVESKIDKIHVPFVSNEGQVSNDQVKFSANLFTGPFFITASDLTYSVKKKEVNQAGEDKEAADGYAKGTARREETTTKISSFRESFVDQNGESIAFEPQGEEPSDVKVNSLKGNDPSKWKSDIATYDSLNLGDIWENIQVGLSAYGKNVEKIFTVRPGGDPANIQLKFDGVDKLEVSGDGNLIIKTELGDISLTKPEAYQEIDGEKKEVDVKYVIGNGNSYGFQVGDYDHEKPLVIDPLLASTYIGGTDDEWAGLLALDSYGNVYDAMTTLSTDFPMTGDGAQGVHHGGYYDTAIAKFNSSLTALEATTYLGGSGTDWPFSIAIDGQNNVYVTGETKSTDYPVNGPNQNSCTLNTSDGACLDAFVTKLDSDLTTIQASRYLGGDSGDTAYGITTDLSGNVIVAGDTSSTNFPLSDSAFQSQMNGGGDAFVTKMDSNLGIVNSTYAGGSNDDVYYAVKEDADGNIFTFGFTYSDDFPNTALGYMRNIYENQYGDRDAVITRFNNQLSSENSTYLGGDSWDILINQGEDSLAIDNSGNVYVAGTTYSSNFPVTNGAYKTQGHQHYPLSGFYTGSGGIQFFYYGMEQVFVSKLSNDLSTLEASTYLGGGEGGYVNILSDGRVAVTGDTWGDGDYPLTQDAYQTDTSDQNVFFLSVLSGDLSRLDYSTFLGGEDDDVYSWAMATDPNDHVYLGTEDYSNGTYPVTPGAAQGEFHGDWEDNVISELSFPTSQNAQSATVNHFEIRNTNNMSSEGFEGGSFPPDGWTTGGDANWLQDPSEKTEGNNSAASGTVANSQQSWINYTSDFSVDGLISFDWKIDSQNDVLLFCTDGQTCQRYSGYTDKISGDSDWATVTMGVPAGHHDLKWEYLRNSSGSNGTNKAWLDNFHYTAFSSALTTDPGASNQITIVARGDDGLTFNSYNGDKNVVFSGAGVGGSNHPKVADKNGTYVNFGNQTTLNFVNGAATTTAKLYKTESGTMDITDGSFSSSGDAAYGLGFTVTGNAPSVDPVQSSISASPDPGTTGTQETITLTSKDTNGDPYTSGGQTVVITVSGSNSATPSATDNGDGTYTATYTPANAGADQITATMNGTPLGADTDGTSDGTYHLTVQDQTPSQIPPDQPPDQPSDEPIVRNDICNGKSTISISSSSTKKTVFDACILEGEKASSDIVSKSSSNFATTKKVSLKSKSKRTLEGKLTVRRLNAKPTKLSLPSAYANSSHIVLNYFRIKQTFSDADLSEAKLYMRIPKSWIASNNIDSLIFISSSATNSEVLDSQKNSENSTSVTYVVTFSKFNFWLSIVGAAKKTDSGSQTDQPSTPASETSKPNDNSTGDDNPSGSTTSPGQSGDLIPLSGDIQSDVDKDGNQEKTTDTDQNSSNGNETFSDPDGSSEAVISTDGNGDGLVDQFIDTNHDGQPDVYWDPYHDIISVIAPVGSDNYEFDSNGDGTPDRTIAADTKEVTKRTDASGSKVSSSAVSNKNKTNQFAFISSAKEYISQHPLQMNSAVAAGLTLPFLPILFQLNSLGDLWLVLKEAILRLFGIIFSKKRRRGWGIVYDKNTGAPIPLATVNIFDQDGVRRESKITNNLGIYFFLVSPGKYALEAIKNGYRSLISQDDTEVKTVYEDDYRGGTLDIVDPDLVNLDIPMTFQKANILRSFLNKRVLQIFLWVIFWGGLLFNLAILFFFPSILNLLITTAYVLLAIMRNQYFKPAGWGSVEGSNGKPVAFAEVKILNPLDERVLARTLTDLYGRYLIVLKEGRYILSAASRDGAVTYRSNITVGKMQAVDEKIVLGGV